MIYKCPSCAAALEYNPVTDRMDCKFCGCAYEVAQLNMTSQAPVPTQQEVHEGDDTKMRPQYRDDSIPDGTNAGGQNSTDSKLPDENRMQCNIYTCTACGAELAINGVESSTFCAYCGQPTIVFSRISSILRPECMIPFTISKDQAVQIMRKRLNKGSFVPKEIKDFHIDRVRGIYIPYWLFDIDYYDRQYLSGRVKRGKSSVTKYYFRESNCKFRRLTVDASMNLNDESSQRLEPYDMQALRPFDVAYMSGFYADCYDQGIQEMQSVAIRRAMEYFNEKVASSVKASSVKILSNCPRTTVKGASYCLLPAWFLTFRYENEAYTMLVNGQTGKLVGTVPFEKKKAITLFALGTALLTPFSTALIYGILQGVVNSNDGDDIGRLLGFLVISGVTLYASASRMLTKFRMNLELTRSKRTERYVKERQD